MIQKTCPIAIIHGDEDPLVPVETSEEFYESELYIVRHGGHGTREIFQNEVKDKIRAFFDK